MKIGKRSDRVDKLTMLIETRAKNDQLVTDAAIKQAKKRYEALLNHHKKVTNVLASARRRIIDYDNLLQYVSDELYDLYDVLADIRANQLSICDCILFIIRAIHNLTDFISDVGIVYQGVRFIDESISLKCVLPSVTHPISFAAGSAELFRTVKHLGGFKTRNLMDLIQMKHDRLTRECIITENSIGVLEINANYSIGLVGHVGRCLDKLIVKLNTVDFKDFEDLNHSVDYAIDSIIYDFENSLPD